MWWAEQCTASAAVWWSEKWMVLEQAGVVLVVQLVGSAQ